MPAIIDDIELTNVEIAKALSAAAAIRSRESDTTAPWIQTEPTTLSEAIAEAVSVGAAILGRGRLNPFDPSAPSTTLGPGALLELAQFSAALLVVADFVCDARPVSSASIAFGVRSKALDVVESFVGVERSLMLLAGMVPVAAAVDGGQASTEERDNAHAVAMSALAWSVSEYCAIAQLANATADEIPAAA